MQIADASRRPGVVLLLEAALIVLSVLLGFGISAWQQGRADEALVERVHETLRREIQANREELSAALANHEAVLERMQAQPTHQRFGIRPALLRNSAWDTALATGGTVHLAYAVTEIAAQLHEMQALHRDAQMLTFEYLASLDVSAAHLSEAELQSMRVNSWRSFLGLERRLLDEYDEALEQLGWK